jgi:putative ABC transport system permease protein
MDSIRRDIRNAIGQWRHRPMLTVLTLITLALGIGANTAVFSLINAIYLKPLAIAEPTRFVQLTGEESFTTGAWTYVRDNHPAFASVTAAGPDRFNLSRRGLARFATSLVVSGEFFDVLGVSPVIGRPFTRKDDAAGAPAVAVVTYGFWQRELGGRRDVIGDTIWLEQQPFQIVGVAPRGFVGIEVGRHVDVIVPMAALAMLPSRAFILQADASWLQIFGRLRPGQSVADATTRVRAWQPALANATRPRAVPGLDASQYLAQPLSVTPAATGVSEVRTQFGPATTFLFGVVGAVLLVACANFAVLVVARFIDRRHELGIRLAVGASRWDLARLLLVENVMIVSASTAIGGVIALSASSRIVPYFTTPAFRDVPRYLDLSPDWRVLGVTAFLALMAALLAAAVPMLHAARLASGPGASPSRDMGTDSPRATRAMRVLLTGQIALSLVLLSAAVLLVRSFVELTNQDIGFQADAVMVVTVSGDLGPNRNAQLLAIDQIRARLQTIPGVDGVTASMITPVSGQMAMAFLAVPGFTPSQPEDGRILANRVSSDHFRVYGTPLLTGRDFDDRDAANAPPAAIVNRAFAERYFAAQDPVGRTILLNNRPTTIVGMTANTKYLTLRDAGRPLLYAPISQWTFTRLNSLRFSLRTTQAGTLTNAVAETLKQLEPEWMFEIRPLAQDVGRSVNVERLLAWCGGLFALLALSIGVVGTYGVFAYAVSRRRREIGLRMAVGAVPGAISRLVLREALAVMLVGAVIGLAGTWMLGRVIDRFLFQLSSDDPTMLAIATLVMLAAGSVAAAVPANQAARLDPLSTLREG